MDKGRLLTLFTSNLKISSVTFGGGGVIVPVMKSRYVDELHWIDEDEMMDMVSIAQSAPGIMAANASLIIGYKIAGLAGALASLFGVILPPMVILTLISYVYHAVIGNPLIQTIIACMGAGVVAVVLNVSIDMGANVIKKKSIVNDLVMAAAIVAIVGFGVSTVKVFIGCAIVSVIGIIAEKLKGKGAEK